MIPLWLVALVLLGPAVGYGPFLGLLAYVNKRRRQREIRRQAALRRNGKITVEELYVREEGDLAGETSP
ncbi:hypothetical protein [Amycolatopsis sp. CA-230715]|uniref:hypothetical protein n=1 Tax=Amycolatopsis sp. CA-230715 TaxID=2745196 RepID=UPI001C00F224|nr:hypothetical protein [Amycolatopsis sp. CA-230715]QWF76818.1 hypothetical protein HUW46_00197 [Amycolatopsis sp. CA-230715]